MEMRDCIALTTNNNNEQDVNILVTVKIPSFPMSITIKDHARNRILSKLTQNQQFKDVSMINTTNKHKIY